MCVGSLAKDTPVSKFSLACSHKSWVYHMFLSFQGTLSPNSFRLRVPPDKQKHERKRNAITLHWGRGPPASAGSVQRIFFRLSLVPLLKNASVSAFLLVPSRKMRVCQRLLWLPRKQYEYISLVVGSLAKHASVSAFFLFPRKQCECISVCVGSLSMAQRILK